MLRILAWSLRVSQTVPPVKAFEDFCHWGFCILMRRMLFIKKVSNGKRTATTRNSVKQPKRSCEVASYDASDQGKISAVGS